MSRRRSSMWITALVIALSLVPTLRAWAVVPLAQGNEEEVEGQESSDQEGSGQSDSETETDPGEGGGAAEEETGPVWTYQMSWMALAGLGLLLLVTVLMYWRLVVVRSRAGA